MSSAIKISDEWMEEVEQMASQLGCQKKQVVDAVLAWFFEGGWKDDKDPFGEEESADLEPEEFEVEE